MNVRPSLALAPLILSCVLRTASAQEAPLRLTLADAVARAEANSQRLAELEARVEAATAAEAARYAEDRPALALFAGYMRTNHVDAFALAFPNQPLTVIYPDVPDNYRTRVDLQWPIYTAGRSAALQRAAGSEREAAAFDVIAGRADVRLEATRAFWALVTAGEAQTVVTRALESADAHVAELRSRFEQGLIPPNDVLSAEAQRSHQRLLAIEARNLRGVAEADLRRVIGDDSRRSLEAAATLDPTEVTAAIERLPGQRAERQALASRVAASREREDAARAAGRPQIALAAGFDYARPNPRIFPRLEAWRESWDVSLNLSWSLWDGGRRRAGEAEAAAATRGLVARAAELDRDIRFEVDQRRLEVEATRAAIEAAADGVLAAAEARRVVGERFAVGVATNTEVLDAQTALLQAELDRTRAIANAQLAIARLERALGR